MKLKDPREIKGHTGGGRRTRREPPKRREKGKRKGPKKIPKMASLKEEILGRRTKSRNEKIKPGKKKYKVPSDANKHGEGEGAQISGWKKQVQAKSPQKIRGRRKRRLAIATTPVGKMFKKRRRQHKNGKSATGQFFRRRKNGEVRWSMSGTGTRRNSQQKGEGPRPCLREREN